MWYRICPLVLPRLWRNTSYVIFLRVQDYANFRKACKSSLVTLNSASSLSSCLALYACLGFLSMPAFLVLLPTGLGAEMQESQTVTELFFFKFRIPLIDFEAFTLLGCYAASIGSQLPTLRDNLSVPSSSVEQSRRVLHYSWTTRPLKMGPTRCLKPSIINYKSMLCNIREVKKNSFFFYYSALVE